ncbi:uncharacterized protein LOC130496243 isoform X2 [Raphanus sativus]|uniref:Uncharacterized protein LOC130496243 isoform X2 n=1 Tax=Raphanus sativus TaxID=3726 RepID=A0A9W3BY66_RAPSA|nr:uncharacterized protein LOC130496243 isoform X2 [Raphanus sativus]XP_056844149.1 uncharacterized protein LOC130496243 isoform X2 [Raphanus sativus]
MEHLLRKLKGRSFVAEVVSGTSIISSPDRLEGVAILTELSSLSDFCKTDETNNHSKLCFLSVRFHLLSKLPPQTTWYGALWLRSTKLSSMVESHQGCVEEDIYIRRTGVTC